MIILWSNKNILFISDKNYYDFNRENIEDKYLHC